MLAICALLLVIHLLERHDRERDFRFLCDQVDDLEVQIDQLTFSQRWER